MPPQPILVVLAQARAVKCPILECTTALTDNKCYSHNGENNDGIVIKTTACTTDEARPLCYWDSSFMELYNLNANPNYNVGKTLETICASSDAFDDSDTDAEVLAGCQALLSFSQGCRSLIV